MSLPQRTQTLIIGAGLAGLSTALHLDGEALLLDGLDRVGGAARSERFEGFTFDLTGHWLHLRDPQIRALILGLLGPDHFVEIERKSRIWSHGVYTRYPFQSNLHGLPPAVIKACVMGAIEARGGRGEGVAERGEGVAEPEGFADWIRFYFGEGIAEHFMIPYNARLWGVAAEEITSRWCQRFVPRPNLEQIIAGAVGCHAEGEGYNARFLYPKVGGIQSVPEALADAVGRAHIHLNTPVTRVDLKARFVETAGGQRVYFERLVNTAPLTRFIDLLAEAPAEVRAARAKLRAADTVYFNVGVRGALGQDDHWIYVPEASWPMYRVGAFSNALPAMAPEGHSSLYVELADRDTPPEALAGRVKAGLAAMGLCQPEQVLFMQARRIPEAYVIYDFDYHASRALIHEWLNHQGLLSIGRYGDWNYSSMEDALINGRDAAARLSGGGEA
ncbi:FAD-dependent oxidoreductase [Myxococcota bacterium]|nr:FAD-dependent oxidoreductase [Myxococcota bacterium]